MVHFYVKSDWYSLQFSLPSVACRSGIYKRCLLTAKSRNAYSDRIILLALDLHLLGLITSHHISFHISKALEWLHSLIRGHEKVFAHNHMLCFDLSSLV